VPTYRHAHYWSCRKAHFRLRGLAWPDGYLTPLDDSTEFQFFILFLLSVQHLLVTPHVGAQRPAAIRRARWAGAPDRGVIRHSTALDMCHERCQVFAMPPLDHGAQHPVDQEHPTPGPQAAASPRPDPVITAL